MQIYSTLIEYIHWSLESLHFQVVKGQGETFSSVYYDTTNYFNLLLSKKNSDSVD